MSIVEDTAKRMGVKTQRALERCAIDLGYIGYKQQAARWLANYVQNRDVPVEVVDWCLSILVSKEVVH